MSEHVFGPFKEDTEFDPPYEGVEPVKVKKGQTVRIIDGSQVKVEGTPKAPPPTASRSTTATSRRKAKK